MTEAQAATTRFCARIVGPLLLIVGAVVIARFNDMVLLIPTLLQDGPLTFVTGLFALVCGLTLFAGHHHWSSPVAIAISLLGLLTILRGIILMLFPTFLAGLANTLLNGGPGALIAGVVALLLGVWLSWAGWFAKQTA